eukprot:5830158-Prymnesium_polylepis.1
MAADGDSRTAAPPPPCPSGGVLLHRAVRGRGRRGGRGGVCEQPCAPCIERKGLHATCGATAALVGLLPHGADLFEERVPLNDKVDGRDGVAADLRPRARTTKLETRLGVDTASSPPFTTHLRPPSPPCGACACIQRSAHLDAGLRVVGLALDPALE